MAEPTTRSPEEPPGEGVVAPGPVASSPSPPGAPTPDPAADLADVPPDPTLRPRHRRRRIRRVLAVAGVVVLVAALGTTAALARHLWRTADAWQDRADRYERDASGLGQDLAVERADLAATRAELEAVRDQLAVAHERIIGLADEKAQLGDDNEVQKRLVDYQERVSDAAGTVALALDQCVQGQQQLIALMAVPPAPKTPPATPPATPPPTDPDAPQPPTEEEIAELRDVVDELCDAATEANIGLQLELSR